jgi:dymeclin
MIITCVHIWFLLRYVERPLNEISLGGLLIAVVLRTIQFNMTRMRDKYLHTNCLAALANMSSQFQHLHNYVAQKIVALFHLLARKHARTLDLLQQQSKHEQQQQTTSNLTKNPQLTDIQNNEYVQDLSIIEDVMRMVLEIINSCLTHTLRHNINLIYTLLYNRDVFDSYRTHPNFQDILQNIDMVKSFECIQFVNMDLSLIGDYFLCRKSRST